MFRSEKRFIIQWHITPRCDSDCIHCYMKESDFYINELKNELSFDNIIDIMDDIHQTLRRWGILGRINFTGGDPLLREDFFEIVNEAKKRNFMVGVMGNPYTLDEASVKRMREVGVDRFQVSIDGLEKTHDEIRGKSGSFKETLKGIRLLNKYGIPSVVMFTVSKLNMHELPRVARLCAEIGVEIFDFSRLVPEGRGKNIKDEMPTPLEYRDLLMRMLIEYSKLKSEGYVTYFGRKENLWTLLYYDLGIFHPKICDKIVGGCSVGSHILTILSDGTVLPCRRLPIVIGKVPEKNIREIFIKSPEYNVLRKIESMEPCGKCQLLPYCRGCRAVAYASHGNPLGTDPQCWRWSNEP